MIVRDLNILRQVSESVTPEEVPEIISKLEKELSKCNNGVGLSAIQIGIPKRIAIIKEGNGYFPLINAKITEEDFPFVFIGEGCLSMPSIYVNTNRYRQITVTNNVLEDGAFREETFVLYYELENRDLMPIAIQHEIDHFDGILIQDKQVKDPIENVTKAEKVGRNDPCPCGSLKKYKKCCL